MCSDIAGPNGAATRLPKMHLPWMPGLLFAGSPRAFRGFRQLIQSLGSILVHRVTKQDSFVGIEPAKDAVGQNGSCIPALSRPRRWERRSLMVPREPIAGKLSGMPSSDHCLQLTRGRLLPHSGGTAKDFSEAPTWTFDKKRAILERILDMRGS